MWVRFHCDGYVEVLNILCFLFLLFRYDKSSNNWLIIKLIT